VTERIPTVLATQEIARHVDDALLHKLEVRRYGTKKKTPRGQKVPAGMSLSTRAEEEENEDSEDSEKETDVDEV